MSGARDPQEESDPELFEHVYRRELEHRKTILEAKNRSLAQKSFILQKKFMEDPKNVEENSINKTVRDLKLEEIKKRELSRSPFYSHERIGNFISKNMDWFVPTFLEINLLLLTYPLQSMKTKNQARNLKEDISHFNKNKAIKSCIFEAN